MFFTIEDFRKIQKWLSSTGVKDTDFNEAILPLKGYEFITIVQDNHNKKITIKELANQLNLLANSDFINVSESYKIKYIELIEAISKVPYRARKLGQIITFLDTQGVWKIFQYEGESLETWNNTSLWIDLKAK